jgi:aarF domain-containing kinase
MNVLQTTKSINKNFLVSKKYATKVRNNNRRLLFGGLVLVSGVFGLYCYGSYLNEEKIEKAKERKMEQDRLDIIANYKEVVARYQTENEITHGWRFKLSLYFRYFQIFILVLPAISMYYLNNTFTQSDSISLFIWQYMGFVSSSLGGLWIKIGQWASTRPDLFSPESVAKIGDLVDRCPVHSFDDTQRVILEQFGINNLNELFDKFDITPIASGAIAQVYEAVLHGEKVAVKILHPGIFELIERDLVIMETLKNSLLYWFPDAQWFGLEDALKQFEQTMKSQTNLRIEGENLKVFSDHFKLTENIVFPEFRMATNDVLVESFCKGVSLKDYLKEIHPLDERKFMAKMGLRAFLKMIILDNFVHADMHSGNILVNYEKLDKNTKRSNKNPNIVVLDVGLTTFASEEDLRLIKDLFKAVGSNNAREGAAVLINYSTKKDMTEADKEGFMNEMSAFFDAMYHASPTYYEGGKGLGEMLAIQRKYHVQHPGNLTTLIVGMIVLEGIGKQLYTDETRIFEDALNMLIQKQTKDNFFVKKYYQNKRKLQVWWDGEPIKETTNLVPE